MRIIAQTHALTLTSEVRSPRPLVPYRGRPSCASRRDAMSFLVRHLRACSISHFTFSYPFNRVDSSVNNHDKTCASKRVLVLVIQNTPLSCCSVRAKPRDNFLSPVLSTQDRRAASHNSIAQLVVEDLRDVLAHIGIYAPWCWEHNRTFRSLLNPAQLCYTSNFKWRIFSSRVVNQAFIIVFVVIKLRPFAC